MMNKAVIIDFMGTIASFRKLEGTAQAIPGSIEAIKGLSDYFDVFISSKSSEAYITSWLKKNNLENFVYIVYGFEDGTKNNHIEKILRIDDYEKIIYIADMPEDFIFKVEIPVIKIAVNVYLSSDLFPKDVCIFKKPLSFDLIKQFIEG